MYRVVQRFFNVRWDSKVIRSPVNYLRRSIQDLSSSCQDPAGVRTRIALPVDYDRVMDFMRDSYFKSEPTLVNIGLTCVEEPPEPLVHLVREHVKEGMTIMAESLDGRIVGVAVNAGSCPSDPERMITFAECCCDRGKIRDVVKFYAHVTARPKLWDRYCVVKIFECCYVSVDSEHHGKGIAKHLVRESWRLARDCGYLVFRIDCTSCYTAKIAEGFGWDCVFSMPYRRHADCGDLVFKHIREPHTEVRVYVDRPLVCKDYCITNPDDCKISSAPGCK